MCTIAGYVGNRPAAPILIEMMRIIEGYDSGYFTGISTIHEGKLYTAKVIGDLDHLLKTTDAAALPGTIGFIHSRTLGNGEGSVEWGHPFVASKDGVPILSHVSNGGAGFFADKFEEIAAVGDAMLAEGYTLPSKERFKQPKIRLADGDAVHISDLTTQYIMKLMDEGLSLEDAAEQAIMTIPSDDVDLNLSVYSPDRIVFSKMSQPMAVSFTSHGAYMSTTALAFPEDAGVPIILPSFTTGSVFSDRYSIRPYKKLPCTYVPFDASVVAKAYPLVSKMLSEKKMRVSELRTELKPLLFEGAQSSPTSLTIYEVLRVLKKEGRLAYEQRTNPGRDGLTAPVTYFYIA